MDTAMRLFALAALLFLIAMIKRAIARRAGAEQGSSVIVAIVGIIIFVVAWVVLLCNQ